MKQYKKYVIPYKSAFILGPIFMIVEVLGEIILPKLMSMIINYGCGQDVTVAAASSIMFSGSFSEVICTVASGIGKPELSDTTCIFNLP